MGGDMPGKKRFAWAVVLVAAGLAGSSGSDFYGKGGFGSIMQP